MTTPPDLRDNRILAALPRAVFDAVTPLLTIDSFEAGRVLQPSDEEIRRCYFPLRGMGSLLVTEASGRSVDTAIVGSEGFIGLPVFLGTGRMPVEATCQVDMDAAAISSDDLRRCLAEEPALANLLQRYTQMILVELARLALCNRVHPLEERIARWLLQVHERLNTEAPVSVTHQFLSEMLGSERPSISLVLKRWADAGLIHVRRGTLSIADPSRLEATACDCYRTIQDELDRLILEPTRHDVVEE